MTLTVPTDENNDKKKKLSGFDHNLCLPEKNFFPLIDIILR